MSGGLFTNQLLREIGIEISAERIDRLRRAHAASYQHQASQVRLPDARDLLRWLSEAGIPWAIATSGRMETAAVNLASLGVDPERASVVTRDQVEYRRASTARLRASGAKRSAKSAGRAWTRGTKVTRPRWSVFPTEQPEQDG
ncbi:phosphoglycolate phosphatase-like HAD superfamily hydrolase [Bradyrhizobium sp. USDA 4011]